mmetsp:Transcript_45175/g.73598  ORF Transcript_45175/g.73598 Transcript_45175/m.73598 type:complete len:139 (-) Transcript_45175:421-837(-)
MLEIPWSLRLGFRYNPEVDTSVIKFRDTYKGGVGSEEYIAGLVDVIADFDLTHRISGIEICGMGNEDETSRLEFANQLSKVSVSWPEKSLLIQFRNEKGWDYKKVLLEELNATVYLDQSNRVTALEIGKPLETLSLEL